MRERWSAAQQTTKVTKAKTEKSIQNSQHSHIDAI